jgi:hypothetical protein
MTKNPSDDRPDDDGKDEDLGAARAGQGLAWAKNRVGTHCLVGQVYGEKPNEESGDYPAEYPRDDRPVAASPVDLLHSWGSLRLRVARCGRPTAWTEAGLCW